MLEINNTLSVRWAMLLLLPSLYFAPASLASDGIGSAAVREINFINVAPELNPSDQISVPLRLAKMSKTLWLFMEDIGVANLETALLIKGVDSGTLNAIVNSLAGIDQLRKAGGEENLKSMKAVVENAFFSTDSVNSAKMLKFLNAANYLDIGALLKPAAAVWMDKIIAEAPKNKATPSFARDVLARHLKAQVISKELFGLSEDYLNWLDNPLMFSIIGKSIQGEGRGPRAYITDGNKLYVAYSSGPSFSLLSIISEIDLQSHKIVDHMIPAGWLRWDPTAMIVEGNTIYVADSWNKVWLIDRSTFEMVGEPIAAENPFVLALGNKKLYIAEDSDCDAQKFNKIRVIDLETHNVIKINAPHLCHLSILDTKLYVLQKEHISKIDIFTDQETGTPIDVLEHGSNFFTKYLESSPSFFIGLDTKLYVPGGYMDNIRVIDPTTNLIVSEPMKIDNNIVALAVAKDKLYVAHNSLFGSGSVSIFDLETNSLIGSIAKFSQGKNYVGVYNDKLIVADDSGISLFDLEKYFYYQL